MTVFDGDIPSIYLQVSDGRKTFDDATCTLVYIHELSHLLSPCEGHCHSFREIEEELIKRAQLLGHIPPGAIIDPDYPTHVTGKQ